jgi:uncharacterized DUF497 family protein
MGITYDHDKLARTLKERGLDFEHAQIVLAGLTVEIEARGTSGRHRLHPA